MVDLEKHPEAADLIRLEHHVITIYEVDFESSAGLEKLTAEITYFKVGDSPDTAVWYRTIGDRAREFGKKIEGALEDSPVRIAHDEVFGDHGMF